MKKYFTIFMAVLCLCAFSISDANAKTRKRTHKKTNKRSQVLKEGYYIIRSAVNPNYVVDLHGAIAENFNNIHLWIYNGTDAQKWYIEQVYSKYSKNIYKIHSAVDYDYVIDISVNSNNVCIYEDGTLESQIWIISKCGNNTYTIESYYYGGIQVLDLDGAIAEEGRNIQIWDSNETNAQRWILEYVYD